MKYNIHLQQKGGFFYNQLKIQNTKDTTTVPIMARIDTRSSNVIHEVHHQRGFRLCHMWQNEAAQYD